MEACNALAEDRLICLVTGDLHGFDDFFSLHLVEFAEQRIFLKSPFDEVLKGDIINLIVEHSV